MPSYIVKANPDEDWYCMWSTVVDAPTHWGSRAELAQHAHDPREVASDRFERADRNGTSAKWPDFADEDQPFGWDDSDFILMEAGPEYREDGCWMLPRANLRDFCERLEAGADTEPVCTWEPAA